MRGRILSQTSYPAPSGTLRLYYMEGCYYCSIVRRTIDRLAIPVEYCNILREPRCRDELFQARGRTTVPVLRGTSPDGDWWMPESLDIIRYLEQHFEHQRSS